MPLYPCEAIPGLDAMGAETPWWRQLLSDQEEFGAVWLIKTLPSCGDLASLLQKHSCAAISMNGSTYAMAQTEKGNPKWLHTNMAFSFSFDS